MSYAEFLASKRVTANREGIDVAASDVHSMLHPWQAELVQWACRIGRAAIWADTGLGKTVMQVEWLRMVTGSGAGLIVAPWRCASRPSGRLPGSASRSPTRVAR